MDGGLCYVKRSHNFDHSLISKIQFEIAHQILNCSVSTPRMVNNLLNGVGPTFDVRRFTIRHLRLWTDVGDIFPTAGDVSKAIKP